MSKRKSARTTNGTTNGTTDSTTNGTNRKKTPAATARRRRPSPPRHATLSPAWHDFGTRLVAALDVLPAQHYLVLSLPGRQRFVQFAQQGSDGIRAECVSNAYLPFEQRLTPADEAALGALGWLAPSQVPFGSRTRGPRDGSPNWHRDFDAPVDGAALAEMAARTWSEVYGVEEPSALRYRAFESGGVPVLLPTLKIPEEGGTPDQLGDDEDGDPHEHDSHEAELEPDQQTLPLRVAEAASCASEDGVQLVGPSHFGLRVNGIDLYLIVEPARYLARVIAPLFPIDAVHGSAHGTAHDMIATMNAEHIAFGYVYARDGEVRYAAELLLEPFYPALVPVTLHVAASIVRALRGAHDDDAHRWTVLRN